MITVAVVGRMAKCSWCAISIGQHGRAQNLAGFTFGLDFERAAADLAIHYETLAGDACVNGHFKRLAAERASNVREFFHAGI
jgi:hypothetical protein